MKKKKIIVRLVLALILLALIALATVFVFIPLFSEDEDVHELNPSVISYEGDGKEIVMENDQLSFAIDPNTSYFAVTEKASGRIWRSNPENADKDPVAGATNKETLQSTAVITYANDKGTVDMNNFKYSIENKNYTITVQEDGSIRVEYAIGKIEKTYLMPQVITKERYVAFTDAMKSSTKKKVGSNYTLYEPSKLDSKKNKDEIIAMYPEVVNQALYILKDGTSDTNKKKIESYFAEVNYTEEDRELDNQLIAQKKETEGPVFNLTYIYRLEGNDLVVEVPYSELRYRAAYPITGISVLPLFGAAGTEDEGFMFIPEGGGAIINFNNGKLSQNSYFANMYGWDYAMYRREVISETKNTFPVFGMAKNDGAFLCLMEGATSYAGIYADISGRYNSYNWMYAKHNVMHADQYNVSAKTAQLVYMYEKEVPQDTVVQRYRFLNTNSYVDMANAYGDYLREAYPELREAKSSETTPVSVEMVGAIDKTVVKFGLPLDTVFAMTTFEQAQGIIKDMLDRGAQNLNVRYTGWANGGVTQKVLTKVNVLWELGGDEGMEKLIKAAAEMNVPLYFDGITCFAYDSGILEGFVPFTNAARFTTREQVIIAPYDLVTYQQSKWVDPYYLVQPKYAAQNATNLINALKDKGAYGVAFRDIGSLLSADYNPKDLTPREDVKEMNVATMQKASAAGQKVMIKQGNDYAAIWADLITDMPLVGTKYSIIDASVPFYQIALHGLKDYTGGPINLANNYLDEYLNCVEYGAGLNFTFMAEDGKVLQDTHHTNFFGANYQSWADDAAALITRYQAETAGLNQQRIVSHEKLAEDIAVTGYEDGTKVYVNYGSEDYDADGVLIPARNYTVERGQ